MRVLLVEDDRDSRDLCRLSLAACGGDVVDVASVIQALGTLSRFRPDVVVSDISMPLRDGFSLIRALRAVPGLADLPALAITGIADLGATLGAGFDMSLRKPFDPSALCHAVETLARARPGGAGVTR